MWHKIGGNFFTFTLRKGIDGINPTVVGPRRIDPLIVPKLNRKIPSYFVLCQFGISSPSTANLELVTLQI